MTVKRKTVKPKKKTPPKKTVKKSTKPAQTIGWDAYNVLHNKVEAAWNILAANVKKKARPEVLMQNRNDLLLLLGECHYMAKSYEQASSKKKG